MYVYIYVHVFMQSIFAKVWKQNVYKKITNVTSTNSSCASSFDEFIREKRCVKIGLRVTVREREREREGERGREREKNAPKRMARL